MQPALFQPPYRRSRLHTRSVESMRSFNVDLVGGDNASGVLTAVADAEFHSSSNLELISLGQIDVRIIIS